MSFSPQGVYNCFAFLWLLQVDAYVHAHGHVKAHLSQPVGQPVGMYLCRRVMMYACMYVTQDVFDSMNRQQGVGGGFCSYGLAMVSRCMEYLAHLFRIQIQLDDQGVCMLLASYVADLLEQCN